MPIQDSPIGAHVEWQVAGMRAKAVEHFGPSSYDATNKETLTAKNYGMESFFLVNPIGELITNSTGAWFGSVRALKTVSGNGVPTWQLRYYDTSGTEIANATDLSGKRVVLYMLGV